MDNLLSNTRLSNSQQDYVKLRLAQSYLLQGLINEKNIELLNQNVVFGSPSIRSLIYVHLDNATLLKLSHELKSELDQTLLLQALIKNNLDTQNYQFLAEISFLFQESRYWQDEPRLTMRLFDKETLNCPRFKVVIERLSKASFEDTQATFCLIGFIQNNFDFLQKTYAISVRAQSEFFDTAPKLKPLKKVKTDTVKLYEAIYYSKNASDDDKAYALEQLIECGIYGYCTDEVITIAQRKRWFVTLKDQFHETEYARRRTSY